MSSAPPGIDVREYGYGVRTYVNGAFGRYGTQRVWLVTAIQVFASATLPAVLQLVDDGAGIPIAPGGCVRLEPNGGYRADVTVQGEGALVILEFWFQASASNAPVPVTVVTTP